MTAATARPALAEGWPARTDRSGAHPVEQGPEPGVGLLDGPRWFYVWNRDPLGECCCWKGTQRAEQVARRGDCQRPGKHPWITRKDGEPLGFVHGAADALEFGQLTEKFGPVGGARQLAVVLDNLIVVDLDSTRALRDFARMSRTVPREKIIGVSTSPRGFHVWLDCPGWNQKALNTWTTDWLAGQGFAWSGTDEAAAGRRGLLVDVRTGSNRYVVWPGSDPDRRWISRAEFGQRLSYTLVGMPAWRMVEDTDQRAPWAVDTDDPWMAGWITDNGGGADISLEGLSFDGSADELAFTWSELERWIERLMQLVPGAGRNNALNQLAFYSGGRCVAAGHPIEDVRSRLIAAGEAAGTHGVAATVDSGLGAGTRALWAAKKSAA